VYVWAGDVRTGGIEKGGECFCPPDSISQPMLHVAVEVHRLNQLKDVPDADLAPAVAYLYDYVNFAHPFREGNGCSTREFFDLASIRTWRRTRLAEDRPD
jgi:cell filamentation protein